MGNELYTEEAYIAGVKPTLSNEYDVNHFKEFDDYDDEEEDYVAAYNERDLAKGHAEARFRKGLPIQSTKNVGKLSSLGMPEDGWFLDSIDFLLHPETCIRCGVQYKARHNMKHKDFMHAQYLPVGFICAAYLDEMYQDKELYALFLKKEKQRHADELKAKLAKAAAEKLAAERAESARKARILAEELAKKEEALAELVKLKAANEAKRAREWAEQAPERAAKQAKLATERAALYAEQFPIRAALAAEQEAKRTEELAKRVALAAKYAMKF